MLHVRGLPTQCISSQEAVGSQFPCDNKYFILSPACLQRTRLVFRWINSSHTVLDDALRAMRWKVRSLRLLNSI